MKVIDEDQGKSGASPNSRTGFLDLVGTVAKREVGIVIALEVSRLARNSPDWSHLLYMCRWTGTLIGDEHGVYDPADSADRMVLGVRGQVSELERDNSVHRMVEARWSKARRGELHYSPPAGYEIDDHGQLVMSCDEAVIEAIQTVFSKFDELRSAGARLVGRARAQVPSADDEWALAFSGLARSGLRDVPPDAATSHLQWCVRLWKIGDRS